MIFPALLALAAAAGPAPGEQLFARRLEPAALDQALEALSAEAAAAPGDARVRLTLARGEEFWAQLHEEATPEEADGHLEVGVRAAGEALALLSPGYRKALAAGKTLLANLGSVDPAGAEALYWIAACQHALAAAHGLSWLLLEEDDLRRLFERVVELAPTTWYGAAHLHLAELELALPTGFGPGLAPAAAELAAAARLGPALLETHLVWAGRWAVKAQDYRAFRRELALIRAAPEDADSALVPENDLVRRKAEELSQSAPELFTRLAMAASDAGKVTP